ncbi:MAG: peptidoglycan bridge formation glycyltransferase FemA/FemB family protein [Candidatus Dojkabacteria bacterium]
MFDFIKFDNSNQVIFQPNLLVSSLFMHTNKWVDFQRALGRNVSQYLILKDGQQVGYLYIENNYRKLAKYAYSPFGPVISSEFMTVEFFSELNEFMKKYIYDNDLNVFRFDPFKWNLDLTVKLLHAGFKRTLAAVGPKYMWEINLSPSEDELLAAMKKVARYNIKQSEKAGITIIKASEQSNTDELVKEFYKILEETTKRQGFASFDWLYFQKQSEILGLGKDCELFLAKYNGQYVSGAWVNYSEDTVSYTHGGSVHNPEIQKFGASYLLHWTVIKHSKNMGKKFYNMWGVVPNDELRITNASHPLRGVSDFKMRFGGQLIENIGGFEVTNGGLSNLINRSYDWWVYRNDRV